MKSFANQTKMHKQPEGRCTFEQTIVLCFHKAFGHMCSPKLLSFTDDFNS